MNLKKGGGVGYFVRSMVRVYWSCVKTLCRKYEQTIKMGVSIAETVRGHAMEPLTIRRPEAADTEALGRFFAGVLQDTYEKEGLGQETEAIEAEILLKKAYLEDDLATGGTGRYFLLAAEGAEIVGTAEFGPTGDIILECTGGALAGVPEVGTVFVRPDRQGQGIGSALLQAVLQAMAARGHETFCLDSGYTRAQKVWRKKLGEPCCVAKDYWGPGYDHLVWHRPIAVILKAE